MRINENTVILGDKVILVPYRAEHVPTYHRWMQSPELLQLTASEPLTLEEEYEMQRMSSTRAGPLRIIYDGLTTEHDGPGKWHLDEDKLTFILLARPESSHGQPLSSSEIKSCRMVGDVNMFLPDGLEGDGECEIMIAASDDRRKGFAREALKLFLSYAIKSVGISPGSLIARIGQSNPASIRLFESLGFKIEKVVEVFDEVQLRWIASPGVNAERQEIFGVDVSSRLGQYDDEPPG